MAERMPRSRQQATRDRHETNHVTPPAEYPVPPAHYPELPDVENLLNDVNELSLSHSESGAVSDKAIPTLEPPMLEPPKLEPPKLEPPKLEPPKLDSDKWLNDNDVAISEGYHDHPEPTAPPELPSPPSWYCPEQYDAVIFYNENDRSSAEQLKEKLSTMTDGVDPVVIKLHGDEADPYGQVLDEAARFMENSSFWLFMVSEHFKVDGFLRSIHNDSVMLQLESIESVHKRSRIPVHLDNTKIPFLRGIIGFKFLHDQDDCLSKYDLKKMDKLFKDDRQRKLDRQDLMERGLEKYRRAEIARREIERRESERRESERREFERREFERREFERREFERRESERRETAMPVRPYSVQMTSGQNLEHIPAGAGAGAGCHMPAGAVCSVNVHVSKVENLFITGDSSSVNVHNHDG